MFDVVLKKNMQIKIFKEHYYDKTPIWLTNLLHNSIHFLIKKGEYIVIKMTIAVLYTLAPAYFSYQRIAIMKSL